MKTFMLKRSPLTNVKLLQVLVTGLTLLSLLLSGCATDPSSIRVVPTNIWILTIPDGADISVQGSYVGQSPLSIPMPLEGIENMGDYYSRVYHKQEYGRADHPIQIEAQLVGYEPKVISIGRFHAQQDRIVQPVFSASAVTQTTPGYYTFPSEITIKLFPAAKR